MPLDLPHPASMPITEITAGDLTWAAIYESPLPTPMIVLGMPILQHPQPQLAQVSSGITLPSHTAPTSLPLTMAHPSTEPLHQHQSTDRNEGLPRSGTNLSRAESRHSSLYKMLRNPSPALPLSPTPPRATTGLTSQSSTHRFNPAATDDVGNESIGSSDRSHNLHQSYSCPLSRDMHTSPTRQAARALSTSFPDPPCHSRHDSPPRRNIRVVPQAVNPTYQPQSSQR